MFTGFVNLGKKRLGPLKTRPKRPQNNIYMCIVLRICTVSNSAGEDFKNPLFLRLKWPSGNCCQRVTDLAEMPEIFRWVLDCLAGQRYFRSHPSEYLRNPEPPMSDLPDYSHCSETLIDAWKMHPGRLAGPNPSRCCSATTILFESLPGGFVQQCCSACRKANNVEWQEFYDLDPLVNCPSCRGEMTVNDRHTKLPGVPGNFVYVCHVCREYVQLADLLPNGSDLFPDASSGDRNVLRRRETSPRLFTSTYLYCPTCQCVRETEEGNVQETGGRGNFYFKEHPDLQWLERNRVCLTCRGTFATVELGKSFMWELVALRDKVKFLLGETSRNLEAAHTAADWLNELVCDLQGTLEMYGDKIPGKISWQELADDPTRKISAIKAYRDQHDVTPAEARKAVEDYIESRRN